MSVSIPSSSQPKPSSSVSQAKVIRPIPMGPVGGIALIVGAVLWLISARCTLTGWVQAINLAVAFVGLPVRLPVPDGWWLLLSVPLGIGYSIVETQVAISWPRSHDRLPEWAIATLTIVFVHATDIGSTALGYANPGPDAWFIHQWMAAEGWFVLVLWSGILTYLPERLLAFGSKWFKSTWY